MALGTAKEEIREEIARITEDRFRAPAEGAGLIWDRNFNYMLASDILSYLHSQGVVIKVDRELPENPQRNARNEDGESCAPVAEDYYDQAQKKMLDAGYVAVEPLVERAAKILNIKQVKEK